MYVSQSQTTDQPPEICTEVAALIWTFMHAYVLYVVQNKSMGPLQITDVTCNYSALVSPPYKIPSIMRVVASTVE